ncbi:MAG TPA: NUDIX domain-containing protein [Kiritimatiellia bacterium]|jgi:isopentenyldiphosphate isomerase|nr:NUDIX domain-containing protein [Kiritimatiellia bacterium]HNS80113.1 NUDIX domain-containing protein [Kiritimatiellia bacterium]HPA77421.1 NUDIX domain-containing protein [Kiritimatiellia bacterium]HQQ03528.1 NUDIX domain-containing protein [Kiritimatiellia bacterium]
MTGDEIFPVVDENGTEIGRARRSECHGNPALIHPVVHVIVRSRRGEIFLQRRNIRRDVQPGKWDTSVGGHMHPGEEAAGAAQREMQEELGVRPPRLQFAYRYLWRSETESELVHTFLAEHEGPFILQAEEIDEGRFWTEGEIRAAVGSGKLTPNFEAEFERLVKHES